MPRYYFLVQTSTLCSTNPARAISLTCTSTRPTLSLRGVFFSTLDVPCRPRLFGPIDTSNTARLQPLFRTFPAVCDGVALFLRTATAPHCLFFSPPSLGNVFAHPFRSSTAPSATSPSATAPSCPYASHCALERARAPAFSPPTCTSPRAFFSWSIQTHQCSCAPFSSAYYNARTGAISSVHARHLSCGLFCFGLTAQAGPTRSRVCFPLFQLGCCYTESAPSELWRLRFLLFKSPAYLAAACAS